MTRRTLPLFALLVATGTAAADDLPAGLKYVPADAALFVYVDVAAVHDSKVSESLKKSKATDTLLALSDVNRLLGVKLGDVKAITFSFPNLQDQAGSTKSLSVVTFRQKYDREKLIAAIKEQAKRPKGEVVVKDNVVKVTTPSPFRPDDKIVTTHDLTDDTRVVSLTGLGDEYLKPADGKGVHTAAIKANAAAHLLAGFNFNALPDEIRGENLPAEIRPFRPILLADGLTAVGTLGSDKLAVSVTVKAKTKGDAVEVEKSLDALRQFAETLIAAAKKNLKDTVSSPKDAATGLDALQAAVKDTTFAVSDTVTTASLNLPVEALWGPISDLFTGGATARAQSSNNLKQLGLAMHNYESANGHMPSPATLGKKGKKLLSWRVEVLPYIEQDDLYKKFKLDEAWDSEHNLKVLKENPMPKVFALPGTANLDDKKTHYQVFVGNGAMFEPTGPTKLTEIADGTSNTFLVATAATAVEWTKPDDIEFDPKADITKVLLWKDGVSVVAFGDGSVRAISEKVSNDTLKKFITRSGGEVVNEDD
jgi:hypothetical protein